MEAHAQEFRVSRCRTCALTVQKSNKQISEAVVVLKVGQSSASNVGVRLYHTITVIRSPQIPVRIMEAFTLNPKPLILYPYIDIDPPPQLPQIPTIKGHKDSIKGPLGGPGNALNTPKLQTPNPGALKFALPIGPKVVSF